MNKNFILAIMYAFVLYGCNSIKSPMYVETSASATREVEDQMLDFETRAEADLIRFYQLLNVENYDDAANLYGGSYEILEGFNPTIEPSDKARLLEAGCQFNGLMCLPVLNAKLVQVIEQHEFDYEVTFKNPDGTPFEMGPCCGVDEETMIPRSIFSVHVVCETVNSCQVMDLPPYVP